MDGIAKHMPAKNATVYRKLRIKSMHFPVMHHPDPRKSAPGAWTRQQFLLGWPAFPLFLLYETTTAFHATKNYPVYFKFHEGKMTGDWAVELENFPASRLAHWLIQAVMQPRNGDQKFELLWTWFRISRPTVRNVTLSLQYIAGQMFFFAVKLWFALVKANKNNLQALLAGALWIPQPTPLWSALHISLRGRG